MIKNNWQMLVKSKYILLVLCLLCPNNVVAQEYSVSPQIKELMPRVGVSQPFSTMPICKDSKYNIYIAKSDNNITYDFSYALNGVPGKTPQFKISNYTQSGKPSLAKFVCTASNKLGAFISDVKDTSNNMNIDYPHQMVPSKYKSYSNSIYPFVVNNTNYEPSLLLNSELVGGVEENFANIISSTIKDKLVDFDVLSIGEDFIIMFYSQDALYLTRLNYEGNKYVSTKPIMIYEAPKCSKIAVNYNVKSTGNNITSDITVVVGKETYDSKSKEGNLSCDFSRYILKNVRTKLLDSPL